jgi:hypothetical protein
MTRSGLILASFLVFVITLSIHAQTKPYTPPRTPDGQPDLQGFWTNSTYVPLERPNGVTKEFYTPQEAVEREKRSASQETTQTAPEPQRMCTTTSLNRIGSQSVPTIAKLENVDNL